MRGHPSYQDRFQMHQDSKIVLNCDYTYKVTFSLQKEWSYNTYKVTLSLQKEWSYKRGTTVQSNHLFYSLRSIFGSVNGRSMWISTMALKNLQQYGCQTGNELKEKSRDINRNYSRFKKKKMKQCSEADTKTVRSLEF